LETQAKAQLFSNTFIKTYKLIDEEQNEYSALVAAGTFQAAGPDPTLQGAIEVLSALKPNSATGPDVLPARILKECAAELALPMFLLACNILSTGAWPAMWLVHWIVPLYKKASVYLPENYRGIHLTSQLSKAMERYIGGLFGQYFVDTVSFGQNQFAYTKGRGSRDAVAFMVTAWICGFCQGLKFGVYCSDVAGGVRPS
jgi:hypothetical protein